MSSYCFTCAVSLQQIIQQQTRFWLYVSQKYLENFGSLAIFHFLQNLLLNLFIYIFLPLFIRSAFSLFHAAFCCCSPPHHKTRLSWKLPFYLLFRAHFKNTSACNYLCSIKKKMTSRYNFFSSPSCSPISSRTTRFPLFTPFLSNV